MTLRRPISRWPRCLRAFALWATRMKASTGIRVLSPAFWNFPPIRSVTAKGMRRGRRNIKNAPENRYARNHRAGASALRLCRPENLRQFVRARDRQLIVTAIFRGFVGPPAAKLGGMPKAVTLHVLICHFYSKLRT